MQVIAIPSNGYLDGIAFYFAGILSGKANMTH
jgi:hypothetical protein